MFGPAGRLYVYFTYGMHHCANVVTGRSVGHGQAVLLRAVTPLRGLDVMRARRPAARNDKQLTDGPGKLCAALGLDRSFNGIDVCDGPIGFWSDGFVPEGVTATARVGISKEIDRPWRWLTTDT